jgi:outer membrane protein TolC
VPPVEELLQQAMANRPELEQTRIDLVNRDINKKAARNALLPELDVFGFYGAAGLGGEQNPFLTCGNPVASPSSCIPAGTVPSSGYPNAFAHLFDSTGPDKGFGVTLNIPIRNRTAQADQVRSELEYRQAQLREQQQKNTIGIEVRNAQYAAEQNRARVVAAIKGRELAQQSLDAEQKKYALGASTNFLVLQAQRDLAQAESNLVGATTAYEKSRVELDRVTANTMQRNGIQLEDALTGQITAMPNVPGMVPRTPETEPNK